MATSAGRILLLPKGTYDSTVTYEPLDLVYYNSSTYVCKATSLGNDPTDTTYWQIFSESFDNDIIADVYDSTTTYAVGDHFIYNNIIYTVDVACTGITPPNASYYTATTIAALIEENASNISTLNSNLTNLFCSSVTAKASTETTDSYVYTVTESGFYSVYMYLNSSTASDGAIYLNGTAIGSQYFNYQYQRLNLIIPVKAGATITCSMNNTEVSFAVLIKKLS